MKTYRADPADHDAVAAALLEKYMDTETGAKCKCGAGLNWLALLVVEKPKAGQVELVMICHCGRLYRAFLPLGEDSMPVEIRDES